MQEAWEAQLQALDVASKSKLDWMTNTVFPGMGIHVGSRLGGQKLGLKLMKNPGAETNCAALFKRLPTNISLHYFGGGCRRRV